jgi:hypothetical protein
MVSRTQLSNGSINQLLLLNKKRRISVTKELMRKSMDLLPTTDLYSHNHGEESRKLIHKMDSKTLLSNGLTNQPHLHKLNNNHAMDFMVLTVKFQSKVFHQSVVHLQLLAITAMGTMLNLKRSTNITINITTPRKILVTKESMKKFMDLLPTTDLFFHNHGEE